MTWSFSIFVAVSALALGQAEPAAPARAVPAATPAQLERRVVGYGGRVDFLFQDAKDFRDTSRDSGAWRGSSRSFGSRGSIHCGGATLVETKGGNLLCAYHVGSGEGSPDSGIWISRFTARDGWSTPIAMPRASQEPHRDPVLFRDPRRAIYLFFKVGRDTASWRTYWCRSDDGGNTWSDAELLVEGDKGGRGPVKNRPIILEDGTWLAPASTDRGDRQSGAWKAFVDRSEDAGETWVRSDDFAVDPAVIPGAGILQPALWESPANEVHALLRTSGGFVARCDSTDGGRTWGPVVPTDLTNNNSSFDVEQVEDGRLLLVYNPATGGAGSQTPLCLAVSEDNGTTWRNAALFENQKGEFFHPCIIATKSGVAVAYGWNTERIRVWQIPIRALDVP